MSCTSSVDFLSSISNDDGKTRRKIGEDKITHGNVNFKYVGVTVKIDGKKMKNTICCQSVVRGKRVVIKIGCHMHN